MMSILFLTNTIGSTGSSSVGSAPIAGEIRSFAFEIPYEAPYEWLDPFGFLWLWADGRKLGYENSDAYHLDPDRIYKLYSVLWGTPACTLWSGGAVTAPGASAEDDFHNGTSLQLPDLRGRAIAASGQGAGLSNKLPGQTEGSEETILTIEQMPAHDHTAAVEGEHTHGAAHRDEEMRIKGKDPNNEGIIFNPYMYGYNIDTTAAGAHTHAIGNTGGGQPHQNIQPTIYLPTLIATGVNL